MRSSNASRVDTVGTQDLSHAPKIKMLRQEIRLANSIWDDDRSINQSRHVSRDLKQKIWIWKDRLTAGTNYIIVPAMLRNRLTPNDPYMGRTAPLTSKRCILYIYSTNIGPEYFKHALHSPFFFFPLQNAVCLIMLTCLVPVLLTFYIQNVLKLKKKNNSGAKGLTNTCPLCLTC